MGEHTEETIIRLFRQKSQMRDIGKSDRFFELGVSSLTIIELQIGVERELGVTISTSELMRLQTMQEWIEAYSALVPHETESSAEGAM